jgi:hypothetical protein
MNKYSLLKCNGSYPKEFLLHGQAKLTVRPAPEPYSVKWENYNISTLSRIIRTILVCIPIVIFILITFVLSYIIRTLNIS